MCLVRVNLLLKYIPKYFTALTLGRGRSYKLTVRQLHFFVVNVVCTDFVPLAFIRNLFNHVRISESCLWRILNAISGSWCTANIAVSSTYPRCTLIPACFLVALQTRLDGILTCCVRVEHRTVCCISSIYRVKTIEVGLFLFFRIDWEARLCQKLVGSLENLQSSISFLQLSLRSRYRLWWLPLLLSDYFWSQIDDQV